MLGYRDVSVVLHQPSGATSYSAGSHELKDRLALAQTCSLLKAGAEKQLLQPGLEDLHLKRLSQEFTTSI